MNHSRTARFCLAALSILFFNTGFTSAQSSSGGWQFAVSGDSRNCGDVVMPAIAASVLSHHPEFYWHLGDFRAIYRFDEDYASRSLPDLRAANPFSPSTLLVSNLSFGKYLFGAWPDFIHSQLDSFGKLPVFLGIGNHEVIPPMSRDAWLKQFAPWLDTPLLRQQRLADPDAASSPRSYYHWKMRGVDFITLDNASNDQFDPAQLQWLHAVLARDDSDPTVKSIVAGMHKALPDSISFSHSMNESAAGASSGREAYRALLDARQHHGKNVYILASHSHLFLANIFNTACSRKNGGVLPGWIVGTAGAVRYRLPEDISSADFAATDVYGYLLATVHPDGVIDFRFQQVDENSVPDGVRKMYTPEFLNWCFTQNRDLTSRAGKPPSCP